MKYLLLCLLLVMSVGCVQPKPDPPPNMVEKKDWPLGTVLVSRNPKEEDNSTPGFWNHLCIYVGDGQCVESQTSGGVIQTSMETYSKRGYTWFPMFPLSDEVGEAAAAKSLTLVGLPYAKYSSLLWEDRHEERGLNCVSVVRVSYAEALGHLLPGLKLPDDILEMPEVFTKAERFRVYYVPAAPLKKAA